MSEYFFFTDTLKPSKAKEICTFLTKRPSWRDVIGGSTGVVVNEKTIEYADIDISKLCSLDIPNAAIFNLSAFCQVDSSAARRLRQPLGSSASIPNGIGFYNSTVRVHSGFYQGVTIFSGFDNSYYYQKILERDYPELTNRSNVHEIRITAALSKNLSFDNNLYSEYADACEKELTQIGKLIDFLRLPTVPHDAYLRCMGHRKNCEVNAFPCGTIRCSYRYNAGSAVAEGSCPTLEYTFVYDSSKLPQWRDALTQFQEGMLKNNSSYEMSAHADYGRMNWFSGYPQCVTIEARDLIRRECENPQYESYNLSYIELESETWEVREKRRKQVTEPRFMQLGECELENGCKLTLRLKMLNEGYAVILDFPTDDDMIRFADTELYRKNKWQSSAE